MNRILASLLLFLTTLFIGVVLGAILALPVMWLWNALFSGPDSILGVPLPPIGFWSAWGLMILSGLLFKSTPATVSSSTP